MDAEQEFWRGRRVFVTGHTGFKGSWLCLWLQSLGAEVMGLALAPPAGQPSLFEAARVAEGMASRLGDIRDSEIVGAAIAGFAPEILIHLAAQPLVRESYRDPVGTYGTNVMGTVHVLEAARRVPGLRAVVNVTTDKCYENREWPWGYRENEAMGGQDPYSSSKGCSELVTSAWRASFFAGSGTALASARAGNVIGGGDWAVDRLLPDILRAFERGLPVAIRNPFSTRPWQHVLEPLSGYLLLARHLASEGSDFAEAWNFGPADLDVRPVQWITQRMALHWGRGVRWEVDDAHHPHEAGQLKLDSSKARARLGWQPRWDLDTSLQRIARWHQAWLSRADARALCLEEIRDYRATPISKAA